jgi:hypothetical protein
MSDISKGRTFISGQRNVSHTDLNGLVDDATIEPAFISGKTTCPLVDSSNDQLVIYDASEAGLRKITPSALIANSVSFTNLAAPGVTQGFVAIGDGAHEITLLSQNYSGLEMHAVLTNYGRVPIWITQDSTWTVTIDASTTGANGVCAGLTPTAGNWYYLWLIYSDTLGTMAGLIADTRLYDDIHAKLPAQYDYACLVGAVYCSTTAGPVLTGYYQYGREVMFDDVVILNARTITTTPANLATTELDAFTGCIPPIATGFRGTINTDQTALMQANASTGYGQYKFGAGMQSFEFPLSAYNFAIGKVSANPTVTLRASGYTLDL